MLLGPGACAPRPAALTDRAAALVLVDDAGRTLRLSRPAHRIVSLMPSATETLVALGAGGQLVARTTYDTLAPLRTLPTIGGLSPSSERLLATRPDVVIALAEATDERLRRDLESVGVPVFSLRAQDTADVFRNMDMLGRLSGHGPAAASLAARLRRELAGIAASVAGRPRPSVFYVVWNNPPMTAGPNTFVGQILSLAGGESIFSDVRENWPTVGLEQVVRRQPEVIVLPSGEMRGDRVERLAAQPGWRDLQAIQHGRVIRLPVDLLNRPGPRLAEAARALRDALHPELAGRAP